MFHTKGVVKERSVRVIIDGGSCNNLASMEMVEKLSLTTRPHRHPYYTQWFNNSGKVKVTRTVHVHFLLQLHQHLHQVPPPAVIQENRHNHHYLPRAHLRGLHSVLLLPWHQQGTQVILFVVVVREEVIMRGNANLRV